MAELKTKATQVSVSDFLDAVPDPVRREDGKAVDALIRRVTGMTPAMWGPSIIGYGSYRYTYDSGHSGEMCRIGFSPRKAELVFYLGGIVSRAHPLLGELGKHRTGKGCLYVKKLADIDTGVLEKMVAASLEHMDATYPR